MATLEAAANALTCRACVVAGPSSGAGKTTVALGLMAALGRRGLVVQPFKCGPDFIDPGHHTRVCDRASRNLDTWMVSSEANRRIFRKHSAGADVSIVEGVMGLFDGVRGVGSTASAARLLGLPVILVVDASGMGASAAAVVNGFATFDATVPVAGVIFNQVASASHYKILLEACECLPRTIQLGYLPRDSQLRIPERHLGLVMAHEGAMSSDAISHLAALVEQHVNVDRLLELSAQVPFEIQNGAVPQTDPVVKIGVAMDQAFCFYYEDNLDALREAGAELVPFSPLHDGRLPGGLRGLYFGGGYPELWAQSLSANVGMRSAVAKFIQRSGAVYAECGGLMYLARSIRAQDGETWPMVGELPIAITMTGRLQRFGYAEVTLTRDCLLGPAGTVARGHSFHYSDIDRSSDALPCAYNVQYASNQATELEGFLQGGVLASYIHLHFQSHHGLANAFVEHARDRSVTS
jgi:cobyrinic acid a,c-diamide synthase